MADDPYIRETDGILRLDLARIRRDCQKLCRCANAHYEIDVTNRIVRCTDCGAIIDPFEALVGICDRAEVYENYQTEMKQRIDALVAQTHQEQRRRLKTRAFKEMEEQYLKHNLLPCCPQCGQPFDPIKVIRFTGNIKGKE